MVATSEIFDFIEQHPYCSIDRCEISSYDFSVLRRNLRTIIKGLDEGDAYSKEIANNLRRCLYLWLTVPVPFDDSITKDISILGPPTEVGRRWGQDNQTAYEASLRAAENLIQNESPLRCEIRSVIGALAASGRSFKIFCHRSARPHFESILATQPHGLADAGVFMHSKDYREAGPFNALIKVGPLRSRGWGSCPDALLTAPRFETLVHLVWSGCGDEQGFGLDPVTGSAVIGGTTGNPPMSWNNSARHGTRWESSVRKTGDSDIENGSLAIDEDEFQVFRTKAEADDKRSAMLVQIDEEHGILCPPNWQILSIDPTAAADDQIGERVPGETLTEGTFLIVPDLEDVDLGSLHAKDGELSPIWKQRLIEECKKDQDGFCEKLFDGGIELLSLHSRVKDWCKSPTTVIPAPQRAEHFKVLIDVLGIDFHQRDAGRRPKAPWWKYAWQEIRKSRGAAISEGRVGQEIVDEKTQAMLKLLRGEIRVRCEQADAFIIEIPPSEELQGRFRLFKVISVEDGFLAPEAALAYISDLREFEQWRV